MEDDMTLPDDVLDILNQVLLEKKMLEEREEQLAEIGLQERTVEVGEIEEDWHLAQHWYDDDTASKLANSLDEWIKSRDETTVIYYLSAPSIFQAMANFDDFDSKRTFIFEIDNRFVCYGSSFVHYDYAEPANIPEYLLNRPCAIIVDPPHLNLKVMRCYAETCKLLMGDHAKDSMIMVNTALSNGPNAIRAMKEIGVVLGEHDFIPGHKRHLCNDFKCYTSVALNNLGAWKSSSK